MNRNSFHLLPHLFRDNGNSIRKRRQIGMQVKTGGAPAALSGTLFQADLDSVAHDKFGLYYPVTFQFSMPSDLADLTAQYRTATSGSWSSLPVYTSAQFFNGIDAIRFDYAGNYAYLSKSFVAASDVLQMQIINSGSNPISLRYMGITNYYDNRNAAVTISLDDWNPGNDASFDTALGILATDHIYSSVAILTDPTTPPPWSSIQTYVDTGYVEACSHSRNHPNNEADYISRGYTEEITGSRDDVLTNLTLANEFVSVYIEPNGFENATVRSTAVGSNYLILRGYPTPPVLDTWSAWNLDGSYSTALFSYYTWDWANTASDLSSANAKFDGVYSANGIYHLVDHPWQSNHWYANSYLSQHMDYIKDKNDVWYASFGGLYLYHYIDERSNAVTVTAVA
jgi:hypothetical protein